MADTFIFRAIVLGRSASPLPKATGEAVSSPAPLLFTVPFPAAQSSHEELPEPAKFRPNPITDLAPLSPLFFPLPKQPFAQFDWPKPVLIPRGARVDDFVNQRAIPAGVVNYISRPPLIVNPKPATTPQKSDVYASPDELVTGTPARPFSQSAWDNVRPGPWKAQPELFRLDVPLYRPNPAQPFVQSDWTDSSRIPQSLKSEVYSGALTLYGPQISIGQPESLDLWDSPTRPLPKAVGEPVGTNLPTLGASVTNQDIWDSPVRALPPQKSDVWSGPLTLYGPQISIGQPESLDLWDLPARPPLKATGEPVASNLLTLTAPRIQRHQDIWDSPVRGLPPQKSDVYDSPDSLTRPRPFRQPLWENAVRAAPKSVSDVYDSPDPITRPNPAAPLVQSDWFQNRFVRKAIVDDPLDISNLLAPARQIRQFDWPNAATPRIKIGGDFSVPAARALYTPNPSRPFAQSDWGLPTRGKALPDYYDWWPGAPYTPAAPIGVVGVESRPLLATMGMLTHIPPSGAAADVPPFVITGLDGTSVLSDGTTVVTE